MTDIAPAFDCAAEYARIEADHAERHRLATDSLAPNKTTLFDALAAAAITSVVVTFDGYGDEGQIENVDARIGDVMTELPDTAIEIATPAWDGSALKRRTMKLAEAIGELAYGFLRETYPGWENNDGAFGEFTFDVAQRTIGLDHNSRYTEVNTSVHEW